MTDDKHEELLGSILCAIAFDWGRCKHTAFLEDGKDLPPFLFLDFQNYDAITNWAGQALRSLQVCGGAMRGIEGEMYALTRACP